MSLTVRDLGFTHITKTGGLSIQRWLRRNRAGTLRALRRRKRTKFFRQTWFHIPLSYFVKDPYEGKTTFTVVRNPYTRLVSEYYSNYFGAPRGPIRDNTDTVEDFNAFIQNRVRNAEDSTRAHPQHRYLPVDRVLHFETLQDDFTSMVNDLLGEDHGLDTTLPVVNKARTSKFTVDDLTPDTVAMINETYARDFELFGYEMRA